jgi:DNA repair protein RecO (recombination protein O)
MSVHQVEAVVLRTWPIHEADQIVSLFTRDYGKIKGVAKSAAKSRRRFGGALEPMTHVRAHYAEKPSQELVRLDSFDILHSPLAEPVDYARAAALAFFAEVLEQTLPDHDPHDLVFRLLLSVLEQTRVDHIWMPITYFALCGTSLAGQAAYFHFSSDGLVCVQHRHGGEDGFHAATLTPDSQMLAVRMFRCPASAFAAESWPRTRGADLRRFAIQSLERHLERKLRTAAALSRLGGG